MGNPTRRRSAFMGRVLRSYHAKTITLNIGWKLRLAFSEPLRERERRRTRGGDLFGVWKSPCDTPEIATSYKLPLPARHSSPSSRLRTSAEKRHAQPLRMRARKKETWTHASLDESPRTQRAPIAHDLSRACWPCPRPRPLRSRVCQNTSLEHHRLLSRGSASRLHESAPPHYQ